MEARGRSAKKSPAASSKKPSYAEVVGKEPKDQAKKTPAKARAKSPAAARAKSPAARPVGKAQGKAALTSIADVMLYYPNLIGYIRVTCMVLAFYYADTDWKKTVGFYLAAFVGDVVDGYVARYFDQCSNFGGVLDMVTDRVSTAGFLAVLCKLYPEYSFRAVMLIVLDIGSHWMHVASVSGHHKSKEVLLNRNVLLQWYYSIYPLFGYCCVGAELFYVLAYVRRCYKDPLIDQIWWYECLIDQIWWYGCLPACALKQVVNVVQLWSAMENLALVDAANKNSVKKA